MKRKFANIGVATLVLSIVLGNNSYSQSIELLTKDNEKYMPVKLFVKKLGGEYKEMEDGYIFNVNGKDIAVKEYASFAKINGHYEPLNVTVVDGWNVPTDTESIYQEDEVYIPALFLQSFQIADYSISGNNLVVEKERVVVKAPVIDKKSKTTKPTTTYKPKPPVNTEKPKDNENKDDTNNGNDNNEDPNNQNNNPGDTTDQTDTTQPQNQDNNTQAQPGSTLPNTSK